MNRHAFVSRAATGLATVALLALSACSGDSTEDDKVKAEPSTSATPATPTDCENAVWALLGKENAANTGDVSVSDTDPSRCDFTVENGKNPPVHMWVTFTGTGDAVEVAESGVYDTTIDPEIAKASTAADARTIGFALEAHYNRTGDVPATREELVEALPEIGGSLADGSRIETYSAALGMKGAVFTICVAAKSDAWALYDSEKSIIAAQGAKGAVCEA